MINALCGRAGTGSCDRAFHIGQLLDSGRPFAKRSFFQLTARDIGVVMVIRVAIA
jgi:hypothetical protein